MPGGQLDIPEGAVFLLLDHLERHHHAVDVADGIPANGPERTRLEIVDVDGRVLWSAPWPSDWQALRHGDEGELLP